MLPYIIVFYEQKGKTKKASLFVNFVTVLKSVQMSNSYSRKAVCAAISELNACPACSDKTRSSFVVGIGRG